MDDVIDFDVVGETKPIKKPSRFAPKQKGKPVFKPVTPKPEPIEIDAKPNLISDPVLKKCKLESEFVNNEKFEGDNVKVDEMELDFNDVDVGDLEMDIEDEEDVIVQEFDVFLTASPLEDDASLYIMQYPLRPSWCPYELNEKCEEVRVKPKQSKVEIDLSLDVESENYDKYAPVRMKTQTLVSSSCASKSSFAVGIRVGNQMHLSPVDAIAQFRPSIAKLIGEEEQRKQHMDAHMKPFEKGKAVPGDARERLEDDEPWVPLEYHSRGSSFSTGYYKKIVAEKDIDIQFGVQQCDFVEQLCPGTSRNKVGSFGPSRSVLLSMTLEERMKKWLSEGPKINRFVALLYISPNDSIEDVLKVLQQYAYLVQGLWVTKSSLLYEGFEAHARDYILSQFSKHRLIRYDKKRTPPENARRILATIAVERTILEDWKFKEDTDISFIKAYPHIVKEQENAWSDRVEQIMSSFRGVKKIKDKQQMDVLINSLNPHLLKKTSDLEQVNISQKNNIYKLDSMDTSDSTRKDLVKAIVDVFQLRGVWSFNSIIKELNGTISGTSPELQSALSEVAVDVHGAYVLKTLRNPDLDPFRNIVIKLFRMKKPTAKLREQDVKNVAQKNLKMNIPESDFNKIVNELCVRIPGGGIQFRSGDWDKS